MTGHKIVEEDESGVIPMSEMKPCQWAVVVESGCNEKGQIVRRTSSLDYFQVDNMSQAHENECWVYVGIPTKVRPIPSGTRLTIEIT